MRQHKRMPDAFSLVELVIVILIIGIIAAIAIPRVSQGARNSQEVALRSDLTTLRNAIDLYSSEHGNTFPGATSAGGSFGGAGSQEAFCNQLVLYSDADGDCRTSRDITHVYGPYLRKGVPPLPVGTNQGSAGVTVSNSAPQVAVASGTGWVYSYMTGEIIANADNLDTAQKTTYDQY